MSRIMGVWFLIRLLLSRGSEEGWMSLIICYAILMLIDESSCQGGTSMQTSTSHVSDIDCYQVSSSVVENLLQ